MQRRTAFAAIAAIFAASLLMEPGTVRAAETCKAAPKSPAPQGSHWYYRTDRALGRKCWYLAEKGQKVVARRATSQGDRNAEPAAEPVAESKAERPVEPTITIVKTTSALPAEPKLAPPKPAALLTAEPGAVTAEATPVTQAMSAPAEPVQPNIEQANIAPQQPLQQDTRNVVPAAQPPAPLAIAKVIASDAPATARGSMLQYVFVAFAGICFFASIALYLTAARRRTTDVVRIVDLNTTPPSRTPASAAAPSISPMGDDRHGDHIDEERLRRFSQAWRREAA